MILGFLAMVVANAAVTLGALSITRRISCGRLSADAVLFLLCRYVLIAAAVLAAGLTRCLTPLALGGAGVAGLAALLATGEHLRLPKLPKLDLGWPLWGAIALIVARLLWQVWFFAPYSVDPLSYHLPKMAQWIQQGSLLPYPGADVRETFPAGFELLETWWTVFLHHDVLIEMAGLEFLALGTLATVALARYAGLGLRPSIFAGLLCALTPALSLQATACMNDGAVAAVILATFALAAHRCHPMLVLAAAAVGLGIKPTFGAALPAAALLLALERRSAVLPIPRRSWALALSLLALGVGGSWYLLNTSQHGNPIYPVGSLSTVDKASPSGNVLVSLARRLNDLVSLAIYDERDHYTVQFILVAGWGAVTFACGGIALIAMMRSNPALRKLAAAFGFTLILAVLAAPPGSFHLRFILFFPALAAIAVAALCEAVPGVLPVAVVAALCSFASSLKPGDLHRTQVEQLTRQSWRQRVSNDLFASVPEGATVACLYGTHDDSNGESYLAYGPGFSRKVVFLTHADDSLDLLARLRSLGATWVFIQARNGDGSLRRIVFSAEGERRLRKIHRNLYEVPNR